MACMERQLCLTFISVYGHIGKRFVMDVDIKISEYLKMEYGYQSI